MVVGKVVNDSKNRKIVQLELDEQDKQMMNSSVSKDLHNLSSKDATQIMNLLASLCQIGILLRNAVDSDEELDSFAQNADKIMKNIDMIKCLDTDKDANGALRNRQVNGLKGIRNLLTTLKRLGLVDAFELCTVTSSKQEPSSKPTEQKGGMDHGKVKEPKPSRAKKSKGSKKSKRSKGSKGSKGSKRSKGSKGSKRSKPKRVAKKQ